MCTHQSLKAYVIIELMSTRLKIRRLHTGYATRDYNYKGQVLV